MKASEIRELSLKDLKAKEAELAKELFSLRMRHATNQLENPIKLRLVKKDMARVKTILAQKGRGA